MHYSRILTFAELVVSLTLRRQVQAAAMEGEMTRELLLAATSVPLRWAAHRSREEKHDTPGTPGRSSADSPLGGFALSLFIKCSQSNCLVLAQSKNHFLASTCYKVYIKRILFLNASPRESAVLWGPLWPVVAVTSPATGSPARCLHDSCITPLCTCRGVAMARCGRGPSPEDQETPWPRVTDVLLDVLSCMRTPSGREQTVCCGGGEDDLEVRHVVRGLRGQA